MKTLIFIIGFVTMLAGSTHFVVPMFRAYHEGKLKQCAEEKLHYAGFSNLYTGYEDVEVTMTHLHASKVIVRVNEHNKDTNDVIKARVAELVREIPGVHTEEENVHVIGRGGKFDLVSNKNKVKDESSPDTVESNMKQSSVKHEEIKDSPKERAENLPDKLTHKPIVIPMPKPKPEREMVRVSSELYVEWNDRKNEINIDGKLATNDEKNAVVEPLKQLFGAEQVSAPLIVSKKLVKAPEHLGEVTSLITQVAKISRGAGSLKYVDDPAKVEIRGGLKNKNDYVKVEELLAAYRQKKISVVNALKYFPEFGIEKNDVTREVILSGYAYKKDSINLSSNVKRCTPLKNKQYTFKSDISPDLRCEEYSWKASDQAMLDRFLANVVRGKLLFKHDKIAEISGVTANEDYHKRLKEEMLGTGVKFMLSYDQDAKPNNAKVLNGANAVAEAGSKEMAEAKKNLKNQLQEYKIYFASGKKSVDKKYDQDIQKIAQAILSSKDKKSKIVIGGYADQSGSAAVNEALSRERATSVQAKLVAIGVPITRTKVEFFGAEKATKEKWRSRRVEIRVR